MTNIKIHGDKHDIAMVQKTEKVQELIKEKNTFKDEILLRTKERDEFRDNVNFLAENKSKLEGKIYVVTCQARDTRNELEANIKKLKAQLDIEI